VRVAIGLDVGTTGARALAVDERGDVVATREAGYPLATPHPGWSEQDPEDWWRASREVLAATASAARDAGHDVVGIGLTGQMHGAVFLDAAGTVIRPAILWNDQRTAAQCDEIERRVGRDRLVEITGNPALTGFQAPKVLWLRDHEPEHHARIAHLVLPKDHVRYRLTGELVTDVADASGTSFLDLRERAWSPDLLDALEVPSGWLPRVHEGPDVAGAIRGAMADELGLPDGILVAAGGGDNAAAAVGTGVTRSGVLSSSIGTSGVVFAHVDEPVVDPSGRVHAFAHAVPGAWCVLGVVLSAGGSLRWWRDVTGSSYDELVAEAEPIPAGSEGLVFLPYLTGERTPHLDPAASGAFVGLTTRHTRGHLTRAVMEGVVLAMRDGLEIMRGLGVEPSEIRAIGGGARSPLWRRVQADVYRTQVRRVAVEEGAAYGAALLGHVVGGTFANVEEATSVVRLLDDVIEPDDARADAYDAIGERYRALYPTLREEMHHLGGFAAR
jgi:xylulokinase